MRLVAQRPVATPTPGPRLVNGARVFAAVRWHRLVWCPPDFRTFVLVDDEGGLLATGTPSGKLPSNQDRAMNYMLVRGSKYSTAAEKAGKDN